MNLVSAATVLILYGMAGAQRSPYAPSGTGHRVLSKYTTTGNPNSLDNRVGEESTTSRTKPQFVGILEENDFAHRVSGWPQERQPFWFINRNSISQQRGKNRNRFSSGETFGTRFGENPQSPFAGQKSQSEEDLRQRSLGVKGRFFKTS